MVENFPTGSPEGSYGARAAIWVGVSTDQSEADEKASLDQQRQVCSSFCRQNEWEIVDVYEITTSGEDPHDPRFQDMIEDGKAKRYDRIVFYDSDRFGRTISFDPQLRELIRHQGVQLVSATEGSDIVILGIVWGIAVCERQLIRKRTSKGRVPGGGLAYGYRKDEDGRLEADPETAPVVQRIHRENAEGLTVREITRGLDEDGIPPPRGKERWAPSQVRRILGNSLYTQGILYYGKTRQARACNWSL